MGTFQTISGVLTVCSVARGLRNIMIMRFKADNVCTLHFQRGHILANKTRGESSIEPSAESKKLLQYYLEGAFYG